MICGREINNNNRVNAYEGLAEQWPDAMAQLDPIGRHTIYFNVMIRCSGIFLFCSLQTITRYFAGKRTAFLFYDIEQKI